MGLRLGVHGVGLQGARFTLNSPGPKSLLANSGIASTSLCKIVPISKTPDLLQ